MPKFLFLARPFRSGSAAGVPFATSSLIALAYFALASLAAAQSAPSIDAAARGEAVAKLATAVREIYVFPEAGERMAVALEQAEAAGEFAAFADPRELAGALTRALRSAQPDRHLAVSWSPGPPPDDGEAAFFADAERQNFGFERVEILAGNVGYLELRQFMPAGIAGETAAGAMAFLAHADALIFDLRRNGGGTPEMIQLLTSYLFDGPPRQLNSFYVRRGDRTEQFWTLPFVPGRRRPDVPVYVLTSAFTFSGAEEFAYNLRAMERATLVGETTGGGAHPVERVELGHGLFAHVSFGRAINPITGTNWEGVGVEPHVKVPAVEALAVAHATALRALAEKAGDPQERARRLWAAEEVEATQRPPVFDAAALARFAGRYGQRRITVEGGTLFFQREGGPRVALEPLSGTTFTLDAPDPLRVRFETGADGAVTGLVLFGPAGELGRSARD